MGDIERLTSKVNELLDENEELIDKLKHGNTPAHPHSITPTFLHSTLTPSHPHSCTPSLHHTHTPAQYPLIPLFTINVPSLIPLRSVYSARHVRTVSENHEDGTLQPNHSESHDPHVSRYLNVSQELATRVRACNSNRSP